jgi:hypothetical protein
MSLVVLMEGHDARPALVPMDGTLKHAAPNRLTSPFRTASSSRNVSAADETLAFLDGNRRRARRDRIEREPRSEARARLAAYASRSKRGIWHEETAKPPAKPKPRGLSLSPRRSDEVAAAVDRRTG